MKTSLKAPISVVVITYNGELYLRECLDSIIGQTCQPSQIVICDDASTDGTAAIIQEYFGKYPTLIEPVFHEKNIGIPANINSGLRRISQEYVLAIAGDDMWMPRKLESEYEALLRNQEADWAYSRVRVLDEMRGTSYLFKKTANIYTGNVFVPVTANILSPRDYLMKRTILDKIGLFDGSLTVHEDTDFKMRLSASFRAIGVEEPNTIYRIHKGGFHHIDLRFRYQQLRRVLSKNSHLIDRLPKRERKGVKRAIRARLIGIQNQGNYFFGGRIERVIHHVNKSWLRLTSRNVDQEMKKYL